MLLKAKDIKVGMRTKSGEVIRSDSQLNAWVIITTDGFDRKQRYLPPDAELEVIAVLASHAKRGMDIKGFGAVIGKFGTGNPEVIGLVFKDGSKHKFLQSFLLKLTPEQQTPTTALLDPQKHLLWAVQHRDWAQARAALTALEKQA